jgi:CHAD domain-containing protein
MQRVLKELDKASADLAADPVHDLRVAIRRCRAMGEAFRELDIDPGWQKMRKAGKVVFDPLGELRDVQVMLEWLDKDKLGTPGDPVTDGLRDLFTQRELVLKDDARAALQQFDTARWKSWIGDLATRSAKVPQDSLVFQYLALERWHVAHLLHRAALRNRSKTAFHQLRIGIKHFRYIVENFLPERLKDWGDDLKELQDVLGEVHDLDVLWDTALDASVFPDSVARELWRAKVIAERTIRLTRYREKMVGPKSLWGIWRNGLPQGAELEQAVLAKLKTWASFRDPDPQHTERVTRFALELHDGLISNELLRDDGSHSRRLLESAAIMHEVGRAKAGSRHHKESARLIAKLEPPENWGTEDFIITALVARYHRGSLPSPEHKRFQQLSADHQQLTRQLAGIMRLADAFDIAHDGSIRRLLIAKNPEIAVIYADGYDPNNPTAEKMAAARHLLETTCDFPIVIRPWSAAK